eukprot:scaffold1518_cov417-Prasinococcus_capsulatus_cf.AAC.37
MARRSAPALPAAARARAHSCPVRSGVEYDPRGVWRGHPGRPQGGAEVLLGRDMLLPVWSNSPAAIERFCGTSTGRSTKRITTSSTRNFPWTTEASVSLRPWSTSPTLRAAARQCSPMPPRMASPGRKHTQGCCTLTNASTPACTLVPLHRRDDRCGMQRLVRVREEGPRSSREARRCTAILRSNT